MTESEFWQAVEQVFGSALGRTLTMELHLLGCRGTAVEALAAGIPVDQIWAELVAETDGGEEARWVHRQPVSKKNH